MTHRQLPSQGSASLIEGPSVSRHRPAVLRVFGGIPLGGTVRVSGSKNATLPMMAAAILASQPLCLQAVPQVADVHILAHLLRRLGLEVAASARGSNTLRLFTVDPRPVIAPYRLVRRMRASFCVLGPLLARRGKAVVSLPGGCNLGDRPVDLHLRGLSALGADLRLEHGYVIAQARRLRGARVELSGPNGPTVTGTANLLSAAVLARGTTVLTGAACEPEIVDLGRLLIAMGARIDGLGTSTIHITGVDQLGGATYRVIPDRIEAATLFLGAAITRGSATVTGLIPSHLAAVLQALDQVGACLTVGEDYVRVHAHQRPHPLDISASPHPGMPTDLQAPWTALLALAHGQSTVRDLVFPDRFHHVAELRRLGACIEPLLGAARVTGVDQLCGTDVTASDLRAGAALVLAALGAKGETHLHAIHHLDRGYERLDEKLSRLGANILRDYPCSHGVGCRC